MQNKNTKRLVIGIAITIAVLLGLSVFFIMNVLPKINTALEISQALQPLIDAENKSMHLVIDAEAGEKEFQLEGEISTIREDGFDYLIIKQESLAFYVVDNMLLLENGNAFLLTEGHKGGQESSVNYKDIFPLLAAAYDEIEVKRIEKNEQLCYQIEVTGEQMEQLLEVIMPSQAETADTIKVLQVQMLTQNGKLDEIQIKGISDSNAMQISLTMTISNFVIHESGEISIPQLIKDSARNADKDELFCLTEDLYRLIKAIEPLSDTSKLQGNMNWKLSCGIIQINTSVDLDKLNTIKPEEGDKSESATATKLLGLVGTFLMEGEITCTKQNEIYAYELVLGEDAMKQLMETISPESLSYAIAFEKGRMTLEIKEEQLSKIMIGIEGGFKVLFTKVPVGVSVEFEFK